MTTSFDDLRVPARPCTGTLAAAGQPRHPRPAGIDLEVPADQAADYGVRGSDGGLVPLQLAPLLDAIAARYDGCEACGRHQMAAVAADPALTVHAVGAALSALLEPGVSTAATVRNVLYRYGSGGAIALVLRAYGTAAAVDLARTMTAANRQEATDAALGQLLPAQWYGVFLGTSYPNRDGQAPLSAAAEAVLLDQLHTDGTLRWRPPAAPPA